jgi:hypothetical protein
VLCATGAAGDVDLCGQPRLKIEEYHARGGIRVNDQIEDAEIVEEHLPAVREEMPPPATLFRTDDPAEIVTKATAVANALSDVIKQKGLFKKIGPKEHVLVEGWTLCGSLVGVFPVTVWTRQIGSGWEARVEARTISGAIVGSAEAMCTREEVRWRDAADYAIRSMAQTRATSKAMRLPLGFIISLAGFEPTPAEEMDGVQRQPPPDREQTMEERRERFQTWGELFAALTREMAKPEDSRWVANAFKIAAGIEYGRKIEKPDDLGEHKAVAFRALHEIYWALAKGGDFPPPSEREVIEALMQKFPRFGAEARDKLESLGLLSMEPEPQSESEPEAPQQDDNPFAP